MTETTTPDLYHPDDTDTTDLIQEGRETGEIRNLLERFMADEEALGRGIPPVFAPAYEATWQTFYREWQRIRSDIDADALTRGGQVDFALFGNLLQSRLHRLHTELQRRDEASPLAPFAALICQLDAQRRTVTRPDGAEVASILHTLTGQVNQRRREWEQGDVVAPITAGRAARAVGNLKETLGKWFRFFDGYDPLFSWWTREPYRASDAALTEWVDVLQKASLGTEKEDDALVGDPIGREALCLELARELIPYTPEELIAIGDREYAWCEAEMHKAASEMGLGDDWMAAVEAIKNRYVAPGEQPYLVRDMAWEATEYVKAHDLVSVPPIVEAVWRMEMMAPERQKVNPFFLGGESIIVSYPTDGMSHTAKQMSLRGNNPHFARATVHHELIPGHHLQLFMAERYRPYRYLFGTPFYVEGWTLHWEMLLWERDFPRSPEDKVGMLFWRMHRCARIAFSLRYHMGQMSARECVQFLVERVGHEPDNALAEVRRSIGDDYPPLYQAAYMLGGLQMHALYKELVDSGTMTPRQFHDAVLRRNAIPLALLRADLTGQPIPRELQPDWKFDAASSGVSEKEPV